MKREMVLERVQAQTRLAVLEDGKLCEIYYERGDKTKLTGNIYAGRVQNILPGMNAAFVDIGLRKNAFLYAGDICFDTRDQAELRDTLEKRRIETMLRPGQMIVVQVVKEPGGSKGPRISGNITLPGRLCVLIPGLKYAGVSKKITDEAERERLFAVAKELSESYGSGVIIRTAGEGAQAEEFRADYERLRMQWQQIETEGRHCAKPRLIQSDGSLTLRCVRDMLDENVHAVRTDDEAVYNELKSYAASLTPNLAGRVELTKTETPLFDLLRIHHQLEAAFERHVYLKSGGNLVIDETEALTVIDVNTAKFTGKKNLSETIFRLNCEAAGEIARQLRLRDIGGIVIIDFIDMETEEEKQALLDHFNEVLKNDSNRVNVLGMTALGLVEMTRKKVRRPLSKQLLRDCTLCLGSGHEWTHESIAWKAVREIWRRRRMGDTTAYCIRTGEKVGGWIQTIGLPGGETRIDINGTDRAFEILPVASGGNAETGNEEIL